MDGKSLNITEDIISRLKEIIPGAFTEGKLNIDQLKQIIGEDINTDNERYQLNWAGKNNAYKTLQNVTTKTLIPIKESSINWDEAQNVFIEGENLDALKIIQKSYYGKIKLIYIDPPYNTGSDSFVYPDKFSQNINEYLSASGELDEDGNINKDGVFRKNNRESGKFHSNWLNMMLPRLYLAKNLLRNDGILFVSIDDNEQANLKLLLDEIFGQECFIGTLPRLTKKSGKSTDSLAKNHDYVLIYGKNENGILKGIKHDDEGFCNIDEHEKYRGKFKLNQTLDYNTLGYVKSLDYEIIIDGKKYYAGNVSNEEWLKRREKNPKDGFRWRWSKELFEFGLANDFIVVKDSGRIYTKTYLNASIKSKNGKYEIFYEERTKPFTSLDLIDNKYSNDNSRKDITSIFGQSVFEYSKPVNLIKKIIEITTEEDDIILDFFSGSGTTAQAVLEQNEIDNKNRSFICVQMPESIDNDSLAYELGYKYISDITLSRINKILDRINHNSTKELNYSSKDKQGVRYFKVDESNFKIWQPDCFSDKRSIEKQLTFFDNLQKSETDNFSILWELLLKNGYSLSEQIIAINFNGSAEVYLSSDHKYLYILSEIYEGLINKIIEIKPAKVICLDGLFKGNDCLKTNFVLKLEQAGIMFKSI